MNYALKHSNFLSHVFAFKKGKIQNFNKFKDTELSQAEKQILRAYDSEKKGKYLKTQELLAKMSDLNPFLSGFRLFLLGGSHTNLAQYGQAQNYLKESIQAFSEIQEDDFIFQPLFMLGIVYMNMKNPVRLKEIYQKLLKLPLNTRVKEFKLERIKIFNHLLQEEGEAALKVTSHVIDEYQAEIEDRMEYYFVLQICALVKLGQFEECYRVLQKCQRNPGYRQTSNYKYIKNMLDHLTDDKSIYAYVKDFKNAPNLFHELSVIKYLQNGDLVEAKKYWAILQDGYPYLYSDNFKYLGDKTLFAMALEKNSSQQFYQGEINLKGKEFKTVYDKLKYILLNHDFKIPKNDLIQTLWQEEWTEKNDQRLRALVYRMKKQEGWNISSKEGHYYINTKKKVA